MNKSSFNLLRDQIKPSTVWDRVYAWIIGTARIVIILVEIIVIIAFGIRVVIDTIGKELDEEVELKNVELSARLSQELEFRNIQSKTTAYESLWKASSNYSTIMEYLVSAIEPLDGIFRIQYTPTKIQVNAEVSLTTAKSLESMIKERLINVDLVSPLFSQAELINIETEGIGSGDSDFSQFSLELVPIVYEENRILKSI